MIRNIPGRSRLRNDTNKGKRSSLNTDVSSYMQRKRVRQTRSVTRYTRVNTLLQTKRTMNRIGVFTACQKNLVRFAQAVNAQATNAVFMKFVRSLRMLRMMVLVNDVDDDNEDDTC